VKEKSGSGDCRCDFDLYFVQKERDTRLSLLVYLPEGGTSGLEIEGVGNLCLIGLVGLGAR